MRGATNVILQTHQILRLPRKMTIQHLAEICGKQLKRHFLSNARPIRPWSENDPTMIRDRSRQSATRRATEITFRAPDEHFVLKTTTFRAPLSFQNSPSTVPVTKSDIWPSPIVLCLPRKVTLDLHQVLRLPQKVTRMLDPRHIWNIIYNARSNKCHPPNSPNTAPATQNDHPTSGTNLRETAKTSFPMRGRSDHDPRMIRPWSETVPVSPQPAAQQRLPFALQTSILYWKIQHFALRYLSKIHQVLRLSRKVTFDLHLVLCLPRKVTLDLHQVLRLSGKVTLDLHQVLRLPRKVTLDLHQVLRLSGKVTHNLHQVLRLPRKVTLDLHQVLHLPRKVTEDLHQVLRLPQKVTHNLHQVLRLPRKVTLDLHQVLHLPRKVTCDLHQVLRLPQKVTRMLDPRHIWNIIYNARSNKCHPPNLPNTAPATQNVHPTSGRNLRKTAKTSFPMRGRSDHDPRMIRDRSRQSATRRATEVTFRAPDEHFVLKNTTFCAPLSFQNSPSTAPVTKSDIWPSPSTVPATKSDTWPSPSTAPVRKSDTWPSPSTAPATKSDTGPSPSTAPVRKSGT